MKWRGGIFGSYLWRNRKGAIALSVSAIVILILAIVILGLGLGFIRGMFSKVSTQVEQQISTEPEPHNPSASNPMTLSRESIITYAGNKEVIKVSAFNPTNMTWRYVMPTISCTNLGTDDQNVNEKTISQGDFETFTIVLTIPPGSPADTHLCEMALCEANLTGQGCNNEGGRTYNVSYLKDLNIKIIQ